MATVKPPKSGSTLTPPTSDNGTKKSPALNAAPVAVDDAATTAEDTALVRAAHDFRGNDTDKDGDALTVTEVQNAVNGTVHLVNGQLGHTPFV